LDRTAVRRGSAAAIEALLDEGEQFHGRHVHVTHAWGIEEPVNLAIRLHRHTKSLSMSGSRESRLVIGPLA